MSTFEGLFASMTVGVLPIIIVVLAIVIKAAKSAADSKAKSGGRGPAGPMNPGDLFHRQGREMPAAAREPQTYSRQVKAIHTGDPRETYRMRMDQLKNLYESGMMERDEYIERRDTIEDDYRNGRQL